MNPINTSRIEKLQDYIETTELRFRTDREFPWGEISMNNRENRKENLQAIVLTFKPRVRNSSGNGKSLLALIEGLICRVISLTNSFFTFSKTVDSKYRFQPENSYSFLDRDK